MTSIVFNIYFIKSTNGLFYYGIDTAKSLKIPPIKILVRRALAKAAVAQFPNSRIVACNLFTFIYEIFLAWRADNLIYTPSSHPLPFLSKQMVVLHDTYPFLSWKGCLKKWLFVASAHTSTCLLAYINHADGLNFYQSHGFDSSRLVFAPNRFPGKLTQYRSKRTPNETRLIIGLVGTDSSKKNYVKLFETVRKYGYADQIVFRVFGHGNEYIISLQNAFTDLVVCTIDSDTVDMPSFLASVDVVVSIAQNEGFGRPIASALESGVPCYLIDNPIFREFFEGGAVFSQDVFSLVTSLLQAWRFNKLEANHFVPRAELLNAFDASIERIEGV